MQYMLTSKTIDEEKKKKSGWRVNVLSLGNVMNWVVVVFLFVFTKKFNEPP